MNIFMYEFVFCILSIILGSFLHFSYKISNENILVSLVSATNESVFEHLKLLFFPILFFSIIEYFIFGINIPNFIPIKSISLLLGMFIIIAGFYTYSGIIGRNYLIADISLFIISICISYFFSYNMFQTTYFSSYSDNVYSIILVILLTISFFAFTFSPPKIGLFKDPSKEN